MDLGVMGNVDESDERAAASVVQQLQSAHFLFQKGIYITGLRQALGAKLWYNDRILDVYWNYATDLHVPSGDEDRLVREVESFYNTRESKPCFYVTPGSQPPSFVEFLKSKGYKEAYSDSWLLIGKAPKFREPKGWEARMIARDAKQDQEAYLRIFAEAYGGPAAEGKPYGNLSPAYVDVLRDSFVKAYSGKTVENCLFISSGTPVAIGMLCYNDKIAGIYGVAVPDREQKKGYGSAATLWLTKRAFDKNAKQVFCMTESDSFVQRMYEGLGFEEKFRARAYAKQ